MNNSQKNKPRVLLYDHEVSPTLQWAYGIWQSNAIRVEIEPFIICFSYRWYGEKTTYNVRIALKKGDIFNPVKLNYAERIVVEKLWKVLDEADIVVGHNAQGFDNKISMAAFLRHNMTPPSSFKTVDTLKVARSVARFNSNSLDNLCKYFGIGQKTDVKHSDVWYDYLNGAKKAVTQMVDYCNQDVNLLYKLYEKLRPYVKNHPNFSAYRNAFCCTNCGGTNLQSRGYKLYGTGHFRYYNCNDCGAWPRERLTDREYERPELVAG